MTSLFAGCHLSLTDGLTCFLIGWMSGLFNRSWINASGLITINVILQAHAINVFITLLFFSFLVLINMRK